MSAHSASDVALRETRLAMLAALIDGDVLNARRLALSLLADGYGFHEIVEGVFAPVQEELGRRWATGDLGIADEHAASEAITELISYLSSVAAPATGPRVVVAVPNHDSHRLGARVVAASLVLEGFDAIFLGTSLPAGDLGDYLGNQQASALVLSCSVAAGLADAAQSIAAAHEEKIPVIVGGRALPNEDRAVRLGADGFALTQHDVTATLQSWTAAPPQMLQTAPQPIPEHRSLWTRSTALVADAMDAAAESSERPDRLADEMRWLLRVLESSVLLDENDLLAEHLHWLRDVGPAHGIGREAVDAGVTALSDALDGDLERLGRVLASAASLS